MSIESSIPMEARDHVWAVGVRFTKGRKAIDKACNDAGIAPKLMWALWRQAGMPPTEDAPGFPLVDAVKDWMSSARVLAVLEALLKDEGRGINPETIQAITDLLVALAPIIIQMMASCPAP